MASLSQTGLERTGDGRFRVTGTLGFDTVRDLLAASREQFAGAANLEIDLTAVSQGDSAGLALLIEWLRMAEQAGQTVRYVGMPPQLRGLAEISDVDELLPVDS